MKKSILSFISLALALAMVCASACLVFSSCSKGDNGGEGASSATQTQGNTTEATTEGTSTETSGESTNNGTSSTETETSEPSGTGNVTESGSVESSGTTESSGNQESTNENETSSNETETSGSSSTDKVNDSALDEIYKDSIIYANDIANGVQAGYVEAGRSNYYIDNLNTSILYSLDNANNKQVTAISTTDGKNYIENTMDVFIRMTDGNVYYASASANNARPNIYRLGYYYYDVHILDQDFTGNIQHDGEGLEVGLKNFDKWRDSVKAVKVDNKTCELRAIINTTSDPYM